MIAVRRAVDAFIEDHEAQQAAARQRAIEQPDAGVARLVPAHALPAQHGKRQHGGGDQTARQPGARHGHPPPRQHRHPEPEPQERDRACEPGGTHGFQQHEAGQHRAGHAAGGGSGIDRADRARQIEARPPRGEPHRVAGRTIDIGEAQKYVVDTGGLS